MKTNISDENLNLQMKDYIERKETLNETYTDKLVFRHKKIPQWKFDRFYFGKFANFL